MPDDFDSVPDALCERVHTLIALVKAYEASDTSEGDALLHEAALILVASIRPKAPPPALVPMSFRSL